MCGLHSRGWGIEGSRQKSSTGEPHEDQLACFTTQNRVISIALQFQNDSDLENTAADVRPARDDLEFGRYVWQKKIEGSRRWGSTNRDDWNVRTDEFLDLTRVMLTVLKVEIRAGQYQ
jgi:hypothetical protein